MIKFNLIFLIASLATISISSPIDEKNDGQRLIKTGQDTPPTWMSETEIWTLIQNGTRFIDITGHTFPEEEDEKIWEPTALPTEINYQECVTPLLKEIKTDRMKTFLTAFSSFHNRYFESVYGLSSEKWLFRQVTSASKQYTAGEIEIKEFEHIWLQPSIIARIEGQDSDLKEEVVIIGAHEDSINLNGTRKRAPGADDNGAGSAVVLEIFRVLVNSQFAPKRSIEFHWYAGEEMGLKGSGSVARQYNKDKRKVFSMINFDVPGYVGTSTDKRLSIITDFTDPELNAFLRKVTETYSAWGWKDAKCGYACSDHASWTNYKYRAGHPGATAFNPYMHTVQDTIDKIDWEQMEEAVKVGLAATIELAEPIESTVKAKVIQTSDSEDTPTDCNADLDFAILLDSSSTGSAEDYGTLKSFVARLTSAFVQNPATRFSFIVYSDEAEIVIPLDNNLTPSEISDFIQSAQYQGGSTRTDLAILLARQQFLSQDRNLPNIMLVITNGVSKYTEETKQAAHQTIDAGIQAFVLGTSDDVNQQDLLNIVGGQAKKVFKSDGLDSLRYMLKELSEEMCP